MEEKVTKKLDKWYRCEHCRRKATHSIGVFENYHHLCTKHWKRSTEKMAHMSMIAILGCHNFK